MWPHVKKSKNNVHILGPNFKSDASIKFKVWWPAPISLNYGNFIQILHFGAHKVDIKHKVGWPRILSYYGTRNSVGHMLYASKTAQVKYIFWLVSFSVAALFINYAKYMVSIEGKCQDTDISAVFKTPCGVQRKI